MDDSIQKALKTWYKPDNPLYLDPIHPATKLAGEAGEMLDQMAKKAFKPGYTVTREEELEELGDKWYYDRILNWQYQTGFKPTVKWTPELKTTALILRTSSGILGCIMDNKPKLLPLHLRNSAILIGKRLAQLKSSEEELTELNYAKLNTPSQHGWAGGNKTKLKKKVLKAIDQMEEGKEEEAIKIIAEMIRNGE